MSYFSTDGFIPKRAWCAVYDPVTGEVVHVHEFIGDAIADDNEHLAALRADTAIAHVQLHTRKGAKGFAVAHGDPKKPPQIGDRVAFDVKKKKLVTSRGLGLQEFARAAAEARPRPVDVAKPAEPAKKPNKR